MTNTLPPSNNSNAWNSEAAFDVELRQYENISKKDVKTMHTDAVTTERGEKGMYFFEEEKKKKGYQVHAARK